MNRVDKFFVQNFGCRATQADGAALETLLSAKGLEAVANIGDDVLHEGLKAGYGATIGVDSVRKLVDAVVRFQETSLQEIEQLRGQATRDSAEIAEYVEQGKQRFAALLQAPPSPEPR